VKRDVAKMIDAAVGYAEAGALVLPLHTPVDGGCSCRNQQCGKNAGKHPRTLRGKNDATSDVAKVERWWGMWPDANIGVRPAPGIVVLDVDPRNGGATSLLNMERKYGRIEPTQTVATGGGGLHIWLHHQGPVRGQLAPGVDLKTDTGYVLMPPSLHRSGRRYSWVNDSAGIQRAPEWLTALLTPATIPLPHGDGDVPPQRSSAWVRKVRQAVPGQRNNILHWAACRFAEAGIDPAPLTAAAREIGLSDWEITRTVGSAFKGVTV
jgi:hypothetical protein